MHENDNNPNPKLGGLNYYTTYMRMTLENEGIDLNTWDWMYSDKERKRAWDDIENLIKETLEEQWISIWEAES